jgi:hypothetical protein
LSLLAPLRLDSWTDTTATASESGSRNTNEYKRLRALGLRVSAVPPCQLCGDPSSPVEPHSEYYAKPYRWTPPDEYMVCKSCHMWIHNRFKQPLAWFDFKAHVRRDGYASEFSKGDAVKHHREAADARAAGSDYIWQPTQGRPARTGLDWWEHLTLNPESLVAAWARPRP